ncbi:MAG: hypothetical protein JO016_10150 [Actinobacteria bacterium]|nr:hypothetical protein [Actinomycetota bacterium]
MSQLPRFSRARQLTASVWSGKAPDDHGSLVAARLRKLAETGSTGTLPFSGAGDGAIHFRDGDVVLARSTRTPSPDGTNGTGGAGAAGTPFTRLTAALAVAEPTIDATVELLSSEARFAKFRSAKAAVSAASPGIGVEDLLTEVARRQRILQQLAPVVTADTVVARNPHLNAPDIGVLAPQWALLIRIRDGSTPRALAWELNRSVFGTTLEIYRLLALRLLSATSPRPRPGGQEPRFGLVTMSYVRAVVAGNGSVTAGPAYSEPAYSEVATDV